MPLNLTESQAINATVDAVNIDSFAVDLTAQNIVIGYQELSGSTVIREQTIVLTGADFAGAITAANTAANAMTAGQVDVYSAIKSALYKYLTIITGVAGTVD